MESTPTSLNTPCRRRNTGRRGLTGLAVLLVLLSVPVAGQGPAPRAPIVHGYAPSPSTQREAGRILRFCRWSDTSVVRDADALLVVVRSSGSHPLSPSYDNFKWLRDDASSQLNESGPQFHVYLFLLRPDQGFRQAVHRSYDAVQPGSNAPADFALLCPF